MSPCSRSPVQQRRSRRGCRRDRARLGRWTVGYCALVVALLATRGLYGPTLRSSHVRRPAARRGGDALRGDLAARARPPGRRGRRAASTRRSGSGSSPPLRRGAGRVALNWSQRQRARRAARALRPTLIVGAGRVGRLIATRLLDQPRARAEADRLPRQGARSPTTAGADRCRCSARAGISSEVVARARRRARGRHLLDRAGRRAPAARPRAARSSASRVALVPAPVRAATDAPHRRAHRRPAARLGAPPRPAGLAVRDQVRDRPRRRRGRSSLVLSPLLLAVARSPVRLARPADPLPPAPRRPRRPRVRHAQVPHDAARRAEPTASRSSSPDGTGARRRRGRRPAHAGRRASCARPRSTSCRSSSTCCAGEMSLVGPRPERPEFVEPFERAASTATATATASSPGSPAGRR